LGEGAPRTAAVRAAEDARRRSMRQVKMAHRIAAEDEVRFRGHSRIA
jgi:hypothetical protein